MLAPIADVLIPEAITSRSSMNARDYIELYLGLEPNGKSILAFLPLGS